MLLIHLPREVKTLAIILSPDALVCRRRHSKPLQPKVTAVEKPSLSCAPYWSKEMFE